MGTTTAIEKHVNKIVERLALPTEEQEEMKVEFISHLEASKADYEKQGLDG